LTFLATFWKPLAGGIAILGGVALSYFKGRQHGDDAATQRAATTVASAQVAQADAQQAQQAAEAKADAAQAQTAATQATIDAQQTAKKVSDNVDQMSPEDVANELKSNWSK
jgi:multidrug efflux pump subunit AcrA (membrane-fusion protein)